MCRRKAERDRRRRLAELSLHQINAFSELEAARAQEQVLGEIIHDNPSAVSRITWRAHPPSDDSSRSLTLHNALEQTRFPVIADDDDQGRATTVKLNLRPSIMTGTNFDQMVSPLVTTTASQHPAFFDDRDNLFTDAAPTPDTGQFASTSLPNRVTSQPTLLLISPVIPTTNLAAMLSSTTRPTTTKSQEIIVKGNRGQPAVSYTTTTTSIHTAVSAATMYRNYGDANNFVPQQGYQPPVDTRLQINTGYAPPVFNRLNANDSSSQIASALERLALTNEAALLPKSEMIHFDGDSKNYQRFMTSFNMTIDSRNIPDSTKLTYLVQYCEGKCSFLY